MNKGLIIRSNSQRGRKNVADFISGSLHARAQTETHQSQFRRCVVRTLAEEHANHVHQDKDLHSDVYEHSK